jgi:potassium efflux system protein
MHRIIKFSSLVFILCFIFSSNNGFAQEKITLQRNLREKQRKAMRLRDSMLRSFNKSDTSINSLLQRIEQYTTTYNQINNNLAEGLDTTDVGESLPAAIKRINKIDSLTTMHKSSTLRYLFVLRDNLDHIQGELEGWQSDLEDINATLIQNQTDLVKLSKDTLLKVRTNDSLLKKTFFVQRKALFLLWRSTDAANRSDLAKINYLQDKIAISYTNLLDESDHIDSKIRKFADRAFAGEFDYIWDTDHQYDDFKYALNSTLKVNKTLFNYFIKNETLTHLTGLFCLVLIFIWIIFNRRKITRDNENFEILAARAKYIYKRPVVASLLVSMAIIPYFYSHPPVVFIEILFLFPMIFVLIFVRKEFPKTLFNFLHCLFWLTLLYSISNLFIEISNPDMFVILGLSIVSILLGVVFLQKLKKVPGTYLPYTDVILKIFIAMQSLSLVLNITGRFSLAKIIGVTAVLNLWMLLILYFAVEIISEALYLQFQTKKEQKSILDWVDYTIVEEKFKKILFLLASLIWLFFLFQNLNIDDAVRDYLGDVLSQSRTVGGASFTFAGFVIFIAVIWLSSIISKIITYFYDVSALRANDLTVLKKKNRTSTLLIRLAVFSIGFLLAVAASNFPLDKITIIISAFGIGIGFGLQNIVNNLVSGLILAFEKPVQIGDIIQIDNESGTIREIGIRASKIATADGAEVIIPNADLISHHVINWTLSNSNRRIELIIGVAYGSEIEKVKTILKELLNGRDDIMTDPAPSVFLHNLNESSVDFRMFFWAADISTWLELKSRVLTDIYARFAQEGIEIPFPTRDLHVHMDDKNEKKDDQAADEPPTKTIDKDEPAAGLEDVKN